ncbi:MAG: Holliday junction resolvase Hjc [Nanobdellota archaeon]
MSMKSRGINAERALVRSFWESGWAAIRVAGSGSSQYPSPDLLVGKRGRRLAIESKITTEKKKYIPKEDIRHLNYFSRVFGAEVWIAIKFYRQEWAFFAPEDMLESDKYYYATPKLAELKGLSFEELIE